MRIVIYMGIGIISVAVTSRINYGNLIIELLVSTLIVTGFIIYAQKRDDIIGNILGRKRA